MEYLNCIFEIIKYFYFNLKKKLYNHNFFFLFFFFKLKNIIDILQLYIIHLIEFINF